MDLVLARADAANMPIHIHWFGYGRSHDPPSLWHVKSHQRDVHLRQGLVRPPRLPRRVCRGHDVHWVAQHEAAHEYRR